MLGILALLNKDQEGFTTIWMTVWQKGIFKNTLSIGFIREYINIKNYYVILWWKFLFWVQEHFFSETRFRNARHQENEENIETGIKNATMFSGPWLYKRQKVKICPMTWQLPLWNHWQHILTSWLEVWLLALIAISLYLLYSPKTPPFCQSQQKKRNKHFAQNWWCQWIKNRQYKAS